MIVIPAIDMKDHQAVRLKQGRMHDATVYADNVLAMAERWIGEGAQRLHLVDLNGAFAGKPVHFKDIAAIAKKFPQIPIQVGGGIRTVDTVKSYLDSGVGYCILGTAAVKNPEFVRIACDNHPGKIILGVDAQGGMVATEGWGHVSRIPVAELLEHFRDCALEAVVYTDIAHDGMLSGMNMTGVATVRDLGFKVIASGGLSTLHDIDTLNNMGGIYGVIAGKAIYEEVFTLKDAIARSGC